MRYIYVILTVLILSSACNAESSPNAPPAVTLPASPNTLPVVQPMVQQPTTPPATQPINMSSDEAIRIARAEIERDAYKQAWQELQKSFDDIKWFIQVTLTAIGIILGLFGFVIFKNTEAYKEAVADAKKACEKAEEWEEKARNTCNKIDDLVKAKLTEIETKNAEQVKNATEKINALVKAKLEESTKKIDDKSENERRISELWNAAFRLDNEGKYEEVSDQFAEIVKLRPNDYVAYNCWGNALNDLAKLKGNEELFKDACGKYVKAIEIKSGYYKAYNNWGATILDFANFKKDTPEYENLLKQAEEKLLKAESLRKGEGAYNLACVYASRDKGKCREWLLVGQEAGTLPTRKHAMEDSDLESVRNEAWFKAIKWKGEK